MYLEMFEATTPNTEGPAIVCASALYVCTHLKYTLPNPKLSDGGGKRTVVMSGRKEMMNDGVSMSIL